MNRFVLPLWLWMSIAGFVSAQVTIPPSTFPVPGDTLYTQTDLLPEDLDLKSPGGARKWNFSALQAPFVRQTVIQNAGSNSPFPEAASMASTGDDGRRFFRYHPDRLDLLGYFGLDPAGFGTEVLIRYQPPAVERWANLSYRDRHETSFRFHFTVAGNDLPVAVTELIPGLDSIRIHMTIHREDVADAWGTLTLPDGNYDVLREKRTETQDTRIEAKLPLFGWQDVTDVIGDLLFPGSGTILTYSFYNPASKEPIATVTTDASGTLLQVDFKASAAASNVQDTRSLQPGVYAYPNPAITYIRFDFTGLRPGTYLLRIHNVLGQEIWSRSYRITEDTTDKLDLSNFRKGTYLYSLQDNRGNTLLTRRFIILRP